jgi:hypothetical protein
MTSQNVCDDVAYNNAVTIQNRFRLLNIPPQRYDNLKNSPYDSSNNLNQIFTQDQLNMRRKAEILKFSANKSSTKTNNLTKKEKWVQLVAGSSQQRNLSYSFIQNNLIPGTTNYVNTCPSGTILYTPTSASNIPGKIMNLYEDPTVPLYMYSTNVNAYGLINQEETTTPFSYTQNTTQFLNQSNSVVVASIYISNILTPTYTFTIQFPISIFISGYLKSGKTGTYNETVQLNFANLPFQSYLYYGSNAVASSNGINMPTITVPSRKSVSFDISMNLNNSDPSSNYFYGNQYIGMYTLSNLNLNTEKGYIYDLCLNNIEPYGSSLINITLPQNTNLYNYFENITYGICANISRNSANSFVNCRVQSSTSLDSYQLLSIT